MDRNALVSGDRAIEAARRAYVRECNSERGTTDSLGDCLCAAQAMARVEANIGGYRGEEFKAVRDSWASLIPHAEAALDAVRKRQAVLRAELDKCDGAPGLLPFVSPAEGSS